MRKPSRATHGFTLIELLTALAIFLIVCGAAFMLLSTSQQRYQTESQVLTSFQEARLGLDQIVRDVNDAGYPPPSFFVTGFPEKSTSTPFAWSPGYTISSPCLIGACLTPGDWDIIIETNPNPQDPAGQVQWIRYQLLVPPTVEVPTLMRGAVYKQSGHDPLMDTGSVMAPLVQNVVNNSSPAQIAQYQAIYPNMFPGGVPVRVFAYSCDTPTFPQPQPPDCASAGPDNSPLNIRDVTITLIVAAPLPDATTGVPRLVKLTGRGRRVNPNQ